MGESNCLDIWSFIIAIISLCVSIWIGVSAQRFSKRQARNENESSEKAFKEMKETNENVKFVKVEQKKQKTILLYKFIL